jgi:hypothetical protein
MLASIYRPADNGVQEYVMGEHRLALTIFASTLF